MKITGIDTVFTLHLMGAIENAGPYVELSELA